MRIKNLHNKKNSLLLWNKFCIQEFFLYKKLFLKKYEYFIQICEKIFQVDSFSYATKNSCVVYVSQYLDSVFEIKWNHFEHDEDLDHTWKEFKNFLLKILKNLMNYKKNISQCLINVHQCDTQSVQDFTHYLNMLQN